MVLGFAEEFSPSSFRAEVQLAGAKAYVAVCAHQLQGQRVKEALLPGVNEPTATSQLLPLRSAETEPFARRCVRVQNEYSALLNPALFIALNSAVVKTYSA